MKNIRISLILLVCISIALTLQVKKGKPSKGKNNKPEEIPKFLELYNDDRIGIYLVDQNNMSLYMFDIEHIGTGFTESDYQIKCTEECETHWLPLIVTGENHGYRAGPGLSDISIGIKQRPDGRCQLTYNNIPLYHYYLDTMPGDVNGHLVYEYGGFWSLITPLDLVHL